MYGIEQHLMATRIERELAFRSLSRRQGWLVLHCAGSP